MRRVFSALGPEKLHGLEVALKKIGKRVAALMEETGYRIYAETNALASTPASAAESFSVGLGNLADKLGPAHVHGPINLTGLRSPIVLEDFHHQGRIVGENDARLQQAQEPG
jgi:hypothetical protein